MQGQYGSQEVIFVLGATRGTGTIRRTGGNRGKTGQYEIQWAIQGTGGNTRHRRQYRTQGARRATGSNKEH